MNTRKVLEERHIRPTQARLAILDVIETATEPIDVATIVERLRKNGADLDTVTIYRNVEILTNSSVIKSIDFRDGRNRYEIEGQHHHHLVCTKCGRSTPIYDQCLAVTEKEIARKFGFVVQDHQLEFFGRCKKCSVLSE